MPTNPLTPAGAQMPAVAQMPASVQTPLGGQPLAGVQMPEGGQASGSVPVAGNAATLGAPLDAPRDPKVWAAAKKFEAMAIGQMLAPMFDTVDLSKSKFGGGQGESAWKPMMVDAIGKQIEAHGGFGLAQPVYAAMLRAQENHAQGGGAQAASAQAGGAQAGGEPARTTHAGHPQAASPYIASPRAGISQAGIARAGTVQAGTVPAGTVQAGGARPGGVPVGRAQAAAAVGQPAPRTHQSGNSVEPSGKPQ
jgi:peptidoglycan hydrolase FlgJ